MKPYYDDGQCVIYHGDCLDVIADLSLSADLVFADPPYGVGLEYDEHDDTGGDHYASFVGSVHATITKVAPICLVTPGIRNLWIWPQATWVLDWQKPGSTRRSDLGGFNEWEPVLVYGKRRVYNDSKRLPDVANHAAKGETGDHPCPKPIRLLTWLLSEFTDEGQMVLDPFLGSGTTMRAAKDMGRRCIGIEKSERYCEIAANRLAQGVLDFGGIA